MTTSTSDAPSPAALRARIEAEAKAAGFSAVGICAPGSIPDAPARLRAFLEAERHGEMDWMADRETWRGDPGALWPEARSVIMLADEYGPAEDPLAVTRLPDRGAISVYARGKDYHDGIKKRLKRVARALVEASGDQVKVFVDTAPVMEKPLGQAAGLGWQGKHTNLLGRDLGSWFFLGAIFTTAALPHDAPEVERCGSCRRCLDACPTDAFPAPFQLDARRCISYLTIELKGPIPREMRALIGNRIYGCDDCLAVCPWNKFAAVAQDAAYFHRPELSRPRLADLAELDDATFREMFSGSPIKRIGRDRFLRNVLIAIGNSADPALVDAARARLGDASPLVRGAAVWALGRLLGPAGACETALEARTDPDPMVAEEWRALDATRT